MSEYVLFSPIGMTDPTKSNYDGALLHILRYYKPGKAYLFMTKEICEYDRLDNRYKKMAQKLLPKCEIKKIKREDIDKPNDFESFHKIFEEEIFEIQKENPEANIIVNLSSGTPQIKTALYFLCAYSKKSIMPIKVDNPTGKANEGRPQYDVESEWRDLKDNAITNPTKNRCSEVKVDNAWAVVSREIVLEQIQTYNYSAAIVPAENVRIHLDDENKTNRIISLLKAGSYRLALNIEEAKKFAKEAEYKLFPIDDELAQPIYEFILYLIIKKNKEELAEFARGISPVITDIFESYLKRQCNEDLDKYCEISYKNKSKSKKLVRNKMPNDILEFYDNYFKFNGGYKDGFISGSNLLPLIILRKGEGDEATKIATRLRGFEDKARNSAAHAIVSITDDILKKNSGMNSTEIINDLKRFFEMVYPQYSSDTLWNSYNELNEEIEKELSV